RRDSWSRADERGGISTRTGSGQGLDLGGGEAGPGDAAGTSDGQAVRDARRIVLHVHHDAGDGADEQCGGAGDPLRGAGSARDARDAWREGTSLVRADLDGVGDVPATRNIGVRVLARSDRL